MPGCIMSGGYCSLYSASTTSQLSITVRSLAWRITDDEDESLLFIAAAVLVVVSVFLKIKD
jgi:hypothetical protein